MQSPRLSRVPVVSEVPGGTGDGFQPVSGSSVRRVAARPLWSSDAVQWGVVRQPDCFDLEDPARHAGLTQHAFPLGRDWMAACGFETPLQRAFDGVRRPLLAMPSPGNPRCLACTRSIVHAVRPRPEPVPVPIRPATTAWGDDSAWRGPILPPPVVAPAAAPAAARVSRPAPVPWPEADLGPRGASGGRSSDGPVVIPVWRATPEPVPDGRRPEDGRMTAGPETRRAYLVQEGPERERW
jgi:hypothetical protein